VSGVAALSRIVTLENVTLGGVGGGKGGAKGATGGAKGKTELVDIQATLQTYRYMDEGSAPAAASPQKGGKGAAKK
jgi:type IV pilus assembly protein PilO